MAKFKGWPKTTITTAAGKQVQAQAPLIVSASRSTDIPAFYAPWFLHRLKQGYLAWRNPFNGVKSYVSLASTRFIVFWSKNPRPLLTSGLLDYLDERHIGCYVQFTLNDYEPECLEPGVPPLAQRLETFRLLACRLGKGHVVWRFDPLLMTSQLSGNTLLHRIDRLASRLTGSTEKLVFSFADIATYAKVRRNLEASGVHYRDWTVEQMRMFAQRLAQHNRAWGLRLATCAEQVDLSPYGVEHNKCIDDDLIIRFAHTDRALMRFLGVEVCPQSALIDTGGANVLTLPGGLCAVKHSDLKDKGQRRFCGCIISKDIGQYNTCAHQCLYCYANTSPQAALANLQRHRLNPTAPTITPD